MEWEGSAPVNADVSVVICAYTLDRWADLQAAARSACEQEPSPLEVVVVVDHNDELFRLAERELRGVRPIESTGPPGLSGARNTGLAVASASIVAFLDDAQADAGWLAALVEPFENPQVVATGGVTAGRFGSGANMAFRRSVLGRIGGFDPALGGGTPARGGEDLAVFFSVLQQGWRLVYQPTMLVRRYHHREYGALRQVMLGYGIGLGAYLAKTIYDRPTRLLDIAHRVPPGLKYLLDGKSAKNRGMSSSYPRELRIREYGGLVLGPFAYLAGRALSRREANDAIRAGAVEER